MVIVVLVVLQREVRGEMQDVFQEQVPNIQMSGETVSADHREGREDC